MVGFSLWHIRASFPKSISKIQLTNPLKLKKCLQKHQNLIHWWQIKEWLLPTFHLSSYCFCSFWSLFKSQQVSVVVVLLFFFSFNIFIFWTHFLLSRAAVVTQLLFSQTEKISSSSSSSQLVCVSLRNTPSFFCFFFFHQMFRWKCPGAKDVCGIFFYWNSKYTATAGKCL